MRPIERGFEAALFMSRWLLAPFLVGLVLTVLMLLFRFFADFVDLTIRLPALSWHELIVGRRREPGRLSLIVVHVSNPMVVAPPLTAAGDQSRRGRSRATALPRRRRCDARRVGDLLPIPDARVLLAV